MAIIPLITVRDGLGVRLRDARPGGGVGILGQVTEAVAAYLARERVQGRIAADADIDSLGMCRWSGEGTCRSSTAKPARRAARLWAGS